MWDGLFQLSVIDFGANFTQYPAAKMPKCHAIVMKIARPWNKSIRRFYSNSVETHNAFIHKRDVPLDHSGVLSNMKAAIKDNFVTTEEATTSASEMLRSYKSPFQATAVALIESAGGRITGKTNMDEFGMGSSNTSSAFGNVTNPLYEDVHISGGSSGGSAAAVALSECDFSLGTDTGGSVRLPASYCEVFGFKPTYGRISRWGVVAYAQSLDTVGIFARDLALVKKVLTVLDIPDDKDPTCLTSSIRQEIDGQCKQSSKVLGVPEQFVLEEMSKEARDAWNLALSTLIDSGYEVKSVSIPTITKLLLAYYTIATAEASSNLSRYDGVRYGYRSDELNLTTSQLFTKNRSTAFGDEVQRRIILGNYTLSSDSGNHYSKATELRRRLVDEFNLVFFMPNVLFETQTYQPEGCCALVCPTAVSAAPLLSDYKKDTDKNFLNAYINDILTVPASLAGLPSLSVPSGNGIGIQIMGQFGDDRTVLDVAQHLINNCK